MAGSEALMNAYIKELLREEREAVLLRDWKRAQEIASERILAYELYLNSLKPKAERKEKSDDDFEYYD